MTAIINNGQYFKCHKQLTFGFPYHCHFGYQGHTAAQKAALCHNNIMTQIQIRYAVADPGGGGYRLL